MSCAPSKKNNNLTCYSLISLQNIAKSYNKYYSNKIKINGQTKSQLWNNIRNNLSNICGNFEYCWMKKGFGNNSDEIKHNTFRPEMPKEWIDSSLTTWLNTDDINAVMKQYEYKYKDFFFIGPVPIDCNIKSKLSCQLTNFNINKLITKGIYKIAVIYNTDISTGPGKHWQALVCIIPKKINKIGQIIFFDSYGSEPSSEIMFLMKKLQTDIKNGNNINMIITWNKKSHQTDSYNCGMYSMYFIIKILEGYTLEQINNMDLSSKTIQKLKEKFYHKQ